MRGDTVLEAALLRWKIIRCNVCTAVPVRSSVEELGERVSIPERIATLC